uniref:Uncharacterized protein n=1 Tax=Rhizophora mucronata TaxID=61149 RepID=A0A2P2N5M6_RHIMU
MILFLSLSLSLLLCLCEDTSRSALMSLYVGSLFCSFALTLLLLNLLVLLHLLVSSWYSP